ncbi:MAG: site-specific DNA-methyltransferase, partial [Treponema sp.]|nr:site-specific DNA-methyltransferase [Treponema sp.]
MAPTSIMFHKDVGHSQEGSQEVTKLLEAGAFDGPKPVRLLRRLLTLANLKEDSIILDFFSGSATSAHAVMQLNAEDDGKRKFIMVHLPELTYENSEAAKAGYKNICEIGKERIRRAGNKVISDKCLVASANAHKNTTHCPLNTNHSLDVISNEEKAKYGCKELSRSDCLAKINGS